MLDLLLIVAMAAVFTFGWFLMRKLDDTLNMLRREEAALGASREHALRIGLSDPLVAGSLTGALAQHSKAHPKASVSLFSGTEAELLRNLNAHELDMVFLPENAPVPEMLLDHVAEVRLGHMPVLMQRGSVQIEPITKGHIQQKIIWTESEYTAEASQLIQYLQGNDSAPDVHTMQ